uniref:Uncharacterized protein n=1 Tax=Tanacetum cinerariifolium TaxID=118510 RepID=A0A6L2KGG6_TANCI|nr:hypothetical protein [Tanacetum cinerariifolium]
MDQDSAHMVAASKVPMLEPGVITEMPIKTAEEKAQRRLEVKARSTLMMGILNKHKLKFNSINDAKKLLEAVEIRFGGNVATKKTQRNLLNQQYKNFIAPSSEMLDQTFDSLKNLVSQLELLEEKLSQKDVNQKLLRKVKGMSSSSLSTKSIAFVSSSNNNTSSSIGAVNSAQAVNTGHDVSTASTQVNATYSTNIDNLSDAVIYSFFASQSNIPPTYIGNFMPPIPDLYFTGLDEFVNKHVVENYKVKSSEEEPKVVRKNDDALIIEEWVSDDEEQDVSQPKIEKKIVKPSIVKTEFVISKQQGKTTRKTVKQFWSTAMAKTINGEVQLHAQVDGKEIVITESSVRRDLQLADEEGIDCLPNSTIFKQLALMGFLQIILDQQLDGVPTHKRKFSAPSHTKKIFGNMKRFRKGFSGKVTPLFQTMVVQNQSQLGEGSTIPTAPQHTPTIIQSSSSQPQNTQKPRKPTRKDTQVPQSSGPTDNVAGDDVHKELGDRLVRTGTTASSLGAEQDNGNITKTLSKATPNERSSLGTDSGGGPRGNTLQSDEDRLKLDELMTLCTNLQNKVLNLEKTKTTQFNEIVSFKRRVKKLEKRNRSRTHGLKRLYKVGLTARVESFDNEESLGEDASKQERRIDAINADQDITVVSVQDDADKEMFDVDDLGGTKVFVAGKNENVVEEVVNAAQVSSTAITITITTEEITLAQALEALKTSKPKDDIQAKIDADHQLPKRLQGQEQEELSDAEKATTMLVEGKEKKAGTELGQEITKKQKVDDDKEKAELNQLMQTIPDEEEVAIDAIPLAVKSPRIIDWKIHKEGMKSYYQIVIVYADLHVGREEISPYTTYTFNDVGKEASN